MQCTHLHSYLHGKRAIKSLKSELYELQTQPFLVKHIYRILLQWTNGYDVSKINLSNLPDEMKQPAQAINSQIDLGASNMIRGIISWKMATAQSTYYKTLQKKAQGDGSMWARRFVSLLLSFTMDCWRYHCDAIHSKEENSAEGRVRTKCKDLLYKLQRDNSTLHTNYLHLLNREYSFFESARISTLDSWIRRIELGIQKKLDNKISKISDIRSWLHTPKHTTNENQSTERSQTVRTIQTSETNVPISSNENESFLLTPFIPCQSIVL